MPARGAGALFKRESQPGQAGRIERILIGGGQLPRPASSTLDHGPPVTTVSPNSRALDHRDRSNKVRLDFIRPATPGDNAINEAFNGSVRRECLSQHYILDLIEAQRVLRQWKDDYNNHRPHGSSAQVPPAHFRAGWRSIEAPSALQNWPL